MQKAQVKQGFYAFFGSSKQEVIEKKVKEKFDDLYGMDANIQNLRDNCFKRAVGAFEAEDLESAKAEMFKRTVKS